VIYKITTDGLELVYSKPIAGSSATSFSSSNARPSTVRKRCSMLRFLVGSKLDALLSTKAFNDEVFVQQT
jgi:hypothetical protein